MVLLFSSGAHGEWIAHALGLLTRRRAGGSLLEPLDHAHRCALGELLDRTQRFPKSARFTFSSRIDNLGLDLLEHLVQARWAQPARKATHLREADLCLSRLRALLRLSHQRRFLDTRGYEHLARALDDVGRQLGGWSGDAQRRAGEPSPT